jgi:hypothetical protein
MSRLDELEQRLARVEKELGIIHNGTVTFPLNIGSGSSCTCGKTAYCPLHGGERVRISANWPDREPSRLPISRPSL